MMLGFLNLSQQKYYSPEIMLKSCCWRPKNMYNIGEQRFTLQKHNYLDSDVLVTSIHGVIFAPRTLGWKGFFQEKDKLFVIKQEC